MPWTTLTLRVSSPLFNGGADQASDAGVRASSIRGAMRFWFRALAGCASVSDLDLLSTWSAAYSGAPKPRLPWRYALTGSQRSRR